MSGVLFLGKTLTLHGEQMFFFLKNTTPTILFDKIGKDSRQNGLNMTLDKPKFKEKS